MAKSKSNSRELILKTVESLLLGAVNLFVMVYVAVPMARQPKEFTDLALIVCSMAIAIVSVPVFFWIQYRFKDWPTKSTLVFAVSFLLILILPSIL